MKTDNKNILYLSYDGMTDPLGQSQVLPYICGLAEKGYNFTLISCEKPARFKDQENIIKAICNNYNIEWHPLQYTKWPPVLSTILDLYKIQRLAEALYKMKKFKLVHCRGYISALVGLYLKKKYKVPFLFDMRGFWADEKVDAGAWNLANPLYNSVYKYFKKKEQQFINESASVVSLTAKGAAEMLGWKHVKLDSEKITIIPCCVDAELFDPVKVSETTRNLQRINLGINTTDFLITYLGSIGTWYMLEEMMQLFSLINKEKVNAKMLFITYDEHDRIRSTASKYGIPANNIIIQPGKRSEVPLLLSLSDFALFFIRPTYSKMSSSPTKQGEIMAMGIPVICNKGVGDTDKIIADYQSGIIVESMDNTGFKAAIEQINEKVFDRLQIRSGAIDYFHLEKGIKQYAAIYKKVIN